MPSASGSNHHRPLRRFPGAVAVERRVRLLQTIHRNISAVDPVGARRGDEHDHIRHLLGGAEAAHRKTVADIVIEVIWIGER